MGEGTVPCLSFPSCSGRNQKDPILPSLGKSTPDKPLLVILTSPPSRRGAFTSTGSLRRSRGPCPTPPPRGGLGDGRWRAPCRAEHLYPNPAGEPRPLARSPARSPRLESCALKPSHTPHASRPPTPSVRLHPVSGAPPPPRGGLMVHSAGGVRRSGLRR